MSKIHFKIIVSISLFISAVIYVLLFWEVDHIFMIALYDKAEVQAAVSDDGIMPYYDLFIGIDYKFAVLCLFYLLIDLFSGKIYDLINGGNE